MDTSSPLDVSPPSVVPSVASHKVRNLLRAIIGLAFAGLFVAGSLSIVKIFPNLALPCGSAHGCDIVNNHPSSKWFGIPVAYFGFGGYLLIAALAVARSGMTAIKAKPLALAGYLVSAFGALTSVGLQIYSLTVIRATCLWCLGSAALMVLLLVFHALEYGERVADEAPDGRGEFLLSSVLAVVVGLALVGFGMNLKRAGYIPPSVISPEALGKVPLVPKDAHVWGSVDAPVTIVEFADLMCPVCQQNSPKVKEYVAKSNGRVRLIYRHFPLPMHPMGGVVAAIAEAAAEQGAGRDGKFWEFASAIMATGENMETPDRVFEVAQSVGLDRAKIDKSLETVKGEEGPAMTRVANDKAAADALGVHMTPTFLVQVKGMPTEAYGYGPLMDALEGKYKAAIEGK